MGDKEIKELVARRGVAKGCITRLVNFVDKMTEATQNSEIVIRLEYLERAFTDFRECEEKLARFEVASELEEYEKKYFNIKTKLTSMMQDDQRDQEQVQVEGMMSRLLREQNEFLTTLSTTFTSSMNQTIQNTNEEPYVPIRLPTLKLPKFSGKYEDFQGFKDIFVASVHSKLGFSDVQKFQYLKGQLEGEAADLIKHITISDANYKQAWEKICTRYDKMKLVLNSLIKTFTEQSAMQQPCVKKLRQLYNTSDEVNRGVIALGDDATKRDPWLIYMLLSKTDAETKEAWAYKTVDVKYPSYEDFLKFLCNRCDALETLTPTRQGTTKSSIIVRSHQLKSEESTISCVLCKDSHRLCYCEKFKSMSQGERREFTAKLRLCFNCLAEGHRANICKNKFSCLKCRRRHHTLLHEDSPSKTLNSMATTAAERPNQLLKPCETHPNSLEVLTTNACNVGPTILPTAVVKAHNSVGRTSYCRLLLDSGSQASFISLSCANKLRLKFKSCCVRIEGVATANVSTIGSTELTVHSRFDVSQYLRIKVFVLPAITTLPGNNELKGWKAMELATIPLADPNYYEGNEIDILLGSDYFFQALKPNQITISKNVIAQETRFGYVIAGGNNIERQGGLNGNATTLFNTIISDEVSLDKLLQGFWEQEELPEQTLWTKEEEACEAHFKATYCKNQEGRFVVQLPLKEDTQLLGSSYHLAFQRLLAMERKMRRNQDFGMMYHNFLDEYIKLGHMRVVRNNLRESNKSICYLPHHGVLRPSSTSTKLRVVFDGSAPTSTGISLNDKLMVGPTLQDTLWTILIRFRSLKIALCADITKMYRQIRMHENHTSLQRILWRKSPKDAIIHFELLTVTYGTSSAPFLAIRVLNQIAEECKNDHPLTAKVIKSNFYVDDLLAGATTEEAALQLKESLIKVLQANGFPLTKWQSNIPSLSDSQNVTEIVDEERKAQLLGLLWDSEQDQFSFRINQLPQDVCSKRNILSIASKIFDPLGWLHPFTVKIKIFMQILWVRKISWDEQLPPDLSREWENIYDQFSSINHVKIPRFIGGVCDDMQLHGFSDASEAAYSAVIYVRAKHNAKYETHLLTAKSKVAPIKQMSIPRLELCGAHLLAKLVKAVMQAYGDEHLRISLWTDSMVVLGWLNSHPRKWKNYVANRLGAIHTLIPNGIWNHVPGNENPADLATRGISANELKESELWFKGPMWLSKPETSWPLKPQSYDTDQETKISEPKVFHATIQPSNAQIICQLIQRYSNWSKLIRIMAYVWKFICIKTHKNTATSKLTVLDLNEVELKIIRVVQQAEFQEDIRSLNKYNQLPDKSRLKQLAPFIDSDGALRVGGRLENATCSYDTKHPLILPRKHKLTNLLLNDLHRKHLHPGPSLLTAISRQKYWIMGVRDTCRRITHRCIICWRHLRLKTIQQMGTLPAARVTPSRPFSAVGIDYAGPIQLSSKIGRGAKLIKGFIVIFVCFATKALHLEMSSTLSTQSFINALERFVGRRGVPMEIYSDNGSNFIGAKRMLYEHYAVLASSESENKINEFAMKKGIKWHFIPPMSPHFGGIWESAVKSVKTHLIKAIGNVHRTFEEIQTVLSQIEGILNSRPLCVITNEDTCNIDALTPGHFLTLGPITALPHANYNEIKMERLNRWEQTQKMVQLFWERYSLTYLNTLQQRVKWQQKERNLQIDDVVIIHDKSMPPCSWLLGRVTELHSGTDGLVRVATVQTKSSSYKRPITKLFRLPLND